LRYTCGDDAANVNHAKEEQVMNSIEEIKERKDGLDVLADIYRYAQTGFQTITPDDEARFRWYGIYTQRPAEDGFFMVRLRIPGGNLTPAQLRVIAELSDHHGRGLADITVRQNIQFHWVRVESLPVILDRLRDVGLSTTEACGDCVLFLRGARVRSSPDAGPSAISATRTPGALPWRAAASLSASGRHSHRPAGVLRSPAFTARGHAQSQNGVSREVKG